MDIRKKLKIALICAVSFILLVTIALTAYLFFSNYQNVRLLQQAESNFLRGDDNSVKLAEQQLLQFVRNDSDSERAFVLLGKIAQRKKVFPEQVYYTYQAHKLNPLSRENESDYIESLLYAREFERLETFLSNKNNLSNDEKSFLLYAAGHNGNIKRYPKLLERNNNDLLAELAILLFKPEQISSDQKIAELQKRCLRAENNFQKQEICLALSRLYLQKKDLDNTEKYLLEAYKLNEFAFAPALGRFYANYRGLGKALEVFEKYLVIYHDAAVALQTAEIYCLLKKRDNIAALTQSYQNDLGKGAMLLNYYFDVLDKFAAGNIASLKQNLLPLQESINTPLATFIYLCAAIDSENLSQTYKYYTALLRQREYLNLQRRADDLVIFLLRSRIEKNSVNEAVLQELAEKVYRRKPDVVIGKFLLLKQWPTNRFDQHLLTDMQTRFPDDLGINKIAVEYYLDHNLPEAEKIIERNIKKYPQRQKDMLRYRIILAIRQKNYDRASKLFQENFVPELANSYWSFAISSKRLDDLRFLARHQEYKPFCEAAIMLAENKKSQALDILARADEKTGNQTLLFYGAKTLAENDRLQDALRFYSKFPKDSGYKLNILLNCSELHWGLGHHTESLRLAKQAYELAPGMRVVQYCYADKLYKSNLLPEIANVIKSSSNPSPFDAALRKYEIASLEHLLKNCDANKDRSKIYKFSERLLKIAPNNQLARHYQKLLQEKSPEI